MAIQTNLRPGDSGNQNTPSHPDQIGQGPINTQGPNDFPTTSPAQQEPEAYQPPPRPSQWAFGTGQVQEQVQQQPAQQERPKQEEQQQPRREAPKARPSDVMKHAAPQQPVAQAAPQAAPEPTAPDVSVDSGYAEQPQAPEQTTPLETLTTPEPVQPTPAPEPVQPASAPAPEPDEETAQEAAEDRESYTPVAGSKPETSDVEGIPSDPTTLVDPSPRKLRAPQRQNIMAARVFNDVKAKIKNSMANIGKRQGRGNGITGAVLSDETIPVDSVSYGFDSFVAAMTPPTSMLRNIVAERAPEANVDQLIQNPVEAKAVLNAVFNSEENPVMLLTTKYPANQSGDTHVRKVRMHDSGTDARLHPLVAKIYNADHDGDTIFSTFDMKEANGAKSAMDSFIGEDGNVNIDTDFFLVKPWGNKAETKKVLDSLFGKYNISSEQNTHIAEAIIKMSKQDKEGYTSLVKWLRNVSLTASNGDKALADSIMAEMLGSVYDYSAELVRASTYTELDQYEYAGKKRSEDPRYGLDKWDRDLSPGELYANTYDKAIADGYPVEEVKGKNLKFRQGVADGKGVKPDSRVRIGKRKWKRDGYEWTGSSDEAVAKAMSGVISLSDGQFKGPSSYLRLSVAKEVGFPSEPRYAGDFKAFASKFMESYNKYLGILSRANMIQNADGTFTKAFMADKPIRSIKNNQSVTSAFKGIYGDITLKALFGASAPKGWEEATVNDFVDRYRSSKVINETLLGNPRDFIKALPAVRTAKSQAFNKTFEETLAAQFTYQKDLPEGANLYRTTGTVKLNQVLDLHKSDDANLYPIDKQVEALTNALRLLGPEAFLYFGFDSPQNVINDELGIRMINATTADQLGGIVYEAIGKYRLNRAYMAQQAGNELKFEQEMDRLASISDVWKLLVADNRAGGTAIDDILLANKPKSQKDKELVDLRKTFKEFDNFMLPYEVALELMSDPSSMHSGPKTLTDFARGGLLDNFKASAREIDASVRENIDIMRSEVEEAFGEVEEGDLSSYLDNIKADKAIEFRLPSNVLVDAMMTGLEKTFASTEKNKQEEAVSALFASASYLRNGGMYSDLEVSDDFAHGSIALDHLLNNPKIIARIIADEKFSIRVYDGESSMMLSRETLIGKPRPSEREIWEWLIKNPRMAMTLRTMSVNKYEDTIFQTASSSLLDSIKGGIDETKNKSRDHERAFLALVDKPGFAALAMSTINFTGVKAPQVRNELAKNLHGVVDFLITVSEYPGNIDLFTDSLVEQMFEGKTPQEGIREDGIEELKNDLKRYISSYATILSTMELTPSGAVPYLNLELTNKTTFYAFYDTIQVLSGSKTELSTGINGAESQRKGIFAFFAKFIPEYCGGGEIVELTPEEFQKDWRYWERCKTNKGITILETTWESILGDLAEGETVGVEKPSTCVHPSGCTCQRHSVADPTTNPLSDKQDSSLARLLKIKRSKGSEENNLKVKKSGDDGLDSITKFDIFERISENNYDEQYAQLNAIYLKEGLPAAREKLAGWLASADTSIRYMPFTQHEYVNIAQRMLQENQDGTLNFFTIGELAAITKQAVADARLTTKKFSDKELQELTVEAMAARASMHPKPFDVASLTYMIKVPAKKNLGIANERQRGSSLERNLELVHNLEAKLGWPTSSAHYKTSMSSEYPAYANSLPKGWTLNGVLDKDHADLRKVIGPTSTWIIGKGAPHDEVRDAIIEAKSAGVTVLFGTDYYEYLDVIEELGVEPQMVKLMENVHYIPFFDILLNGPSTSGNLGAVNVGVYRISGPEEVVTMIEDPFNSLGQGDSAGIAMQGFFDRSYAADQGDYRLLITDAFPQLLEMKPDATIHMDLPQKAEIEAYIVNGLKPMAPIDMGNQFNLGEGRYEEADRAIERYAERFGETDDNGWLPYAKPNEIIGWIRGNAGGMIAWHPVRMYQPGGAKAAPAQEFTIDRYSYNEEARSRSTASLIVSWSMEAPLQGSTAKIFEHWFPTNKIMLASQPPKYMPYRELENGVPADIYIAEASTESRRMTYKTQQAMCSMMAMARITGNGYNFADAEGSFPNPYDADFKEGLRTGILTISDWAERLEAGPLEFFPKDVKNSDAMNSFMKQVANKAIMAGVNPSDVFASAYEGVQTLHWFRFNAVLSDQPAFVDSFMQFFNFMDSSMCPPDSTTKSTSTLFNEKLQMLVPFTTADGKVFKDWAYVYTGLHFFDSHYSGFTAPGMNPVSHRGMSVDNTLLLGGRYLSDDKIDDYLGWSLMDKPLASANLWVTPDTFAEDKGGE